MFTSTICRFCLATCLMVFAWHACAQEFSVLERQLRDHPLLIQLEHEALALREQATAARALPDPELSLGINNVPLSSPSFDRYLPSNKSIGVVQSIPSRAGRQALKTRMQASARHYDALTEATFAELRGQVIADLADLRRINEQRALTQQKSRRLDELVSVVKSEIDAGRPAVYRLAEIESDRADIARLLVALDGQEARTRASLAENVGPVTVPAVPEVEGMTWSGEPRQFHAVRVAAIKTQVADAELLRAKAAWKSNWGVHLTYQQRSSSRQNNNTRFDGDDWFSAGVSLTLPIWGKHKQAPNVRAASARRSSALMHQQTSLRQIIARYQTLRAEFETAAASQRVLEQNIEAVHVESEALRNYYESGDGDYAPVIRREIAILNLRSLMAAERAHERSAAARLNALLVTP